MLWTLVEKEARDLIGSTKFVVLLAVMVLLVLTSFYVGAESYKMNVAQYRAAKAEDLRQYDGLTDWMQARHHRVFLTPQPLWSLVSGVSNDLGRTTEIQGRGELQAYDSKFNEDPIFAVFRFLDLQFLFQIILSLFAVLLGYDAVCGEKERGTLRLTFANSVSRVKFLMGKLLGGTLAMVVPLLLALALGALLLPVLGVNLSSSEWARLGLIIISGMLYFGVFLTISIFVSTLTHRSANSFLILLAFWVVSVLVVPRTAVTIAGRAVDVPSIDELATKKAAYSSQLFQEDRKKWTSFQPTKKDSPDQMVKELNEFMEKQAKERDEKMKDFSGRLNETRLNAQRQQSRLALALARISPTASFTLAATDLAGSSPELKSRYQDDVANYQKVYGEFMLEKTGINPGGSMMVVKMKDDDTKPKPIDPNELPKFSSTPVASASAISTAMPNIVLLVLYNLLALAGAFVAIQRYDLR